MENHLFGGEGGIRTHGSCESPVFKTGSLNHSDTSPCLNDSLNIIPQLIDFVNKKFKIISVLPLCCKQVDIAIWKFPLTDKFLKLFLDINNVLLYNLMVVGMWLSLVECCVRDAEVASSNLVTSTIFLSNRIFMRFVFYSTRFLHVL